MWSSTIAMLLAIAYAISPTTTPQASYAATIGWELGGANAALRLYVSGDTREVFYLEIEPDPSQPLIAMWDVKSPSYSFAGNRLASLSADLPLVVNTTGRHQPKMLHIEADWTAVTDEEPIQGSIHGRCESERALGFIRLATVDIQIKRKLPAPHDAGIITFPVGCEP